MPWPYDEEPYAPEVDPRLGSGPQMPTMPISEPDYGAELQGPQEPTEGDFWSNLARRSGPQPFGFRMRHKPTGLEVLLGLAAAVGNARVSAAAVKNQGVDQRNTRAREAAKTLATWRHEERKAESARLENRANVSGNRAYQERKTAEQRAYDEAKLNAPPSEGELQGIQQRAKQSALGHREGAPLAPPRLRVPTIKPGPVMPELSTTAANLRRKALDFRASGNTAQADSLRQLSSDIDDIHAKVRQAQSLDDLSNIDVPGNMPEEVLAKLKMAHNNRARQLGAAR